MASLMQKLKARFCVLSVYVSNCLFIRKLGADCLPLSAPKGKRVLVVGTGPSVDSLSEHQISGYDAIYLINHAILNPLFFRMSYQKPSLAWYSGDTIRAKELCDLLGDRPDIPKLFAPFIDSHLLLASFLSGAPNFSFIKVKSRSGRGGISTFIQLLLTGGYPDFAFKDLLQDIEEYLSGRNASLPVTGYSSALSLCLFLCRLGFLKIDLIGCDFSSGRGSVHSSQGSATFDQTDTAERFKIMAIFLGMKGFELNNLSWQLSKS